MGFLYSRRREASGTKEDAHEQEWSMSHFKKLADAMLFAPEKMKKNAVFETDKFLCDTYCFEPGQEQTPHTHALDPFPTRAPKIFR